MSNLETSASQFLSNLPNHTKRHVALPVPAQRETSLTLPYNVASVVSFAMIDSQNIRKKSEPGVNISILMW